MNVTDFEGLCVGLAGPLARLALADWLKESGEVEGAQVVRGLWGALTLPQRRRKNFRDEEHGCLRVYQRGNWRWRLPSIEDEFTSCDLADAMQLLGATSQASAAHRAILLTISAMLGLSEWCWEVSISVEQPLWIDFYDPNVPGGYRP